MIKKDIELMLKKPKSTSNLGEEATKKFQHLLETQDLTTKNEDLPTNNIDYHEIPRTTP